jgi:hypothetical protein
MLWRERASNYCGTSSIAALQQGIYALGFWQIVAAAGFVLRKYLMIFF